MSLLLLFQSGAPPTFADGALAATGTGTAAFVGLAIQSDGVLSATGRAEATFIAADAGATNVGGGDDYTVRGSAYWKKYARETAALNKKKKKKLETLDELLDEVKARIVPWREAQERAKIGEQTMLRAALDRPVNMDSTLQAIETEIVRVRALVEELDEEEALLMLV